MSASFRIFAFSCIFSIFFDFSLVFKIYILYNAGIKNYLNVFLTMYYIISLNSKGEYNMKFGYFDDANRRIRHHDSQNSACHGSTTWDVTSSFL